MSPNAAFQPPSEEWIPRLMVIDGCNIGRSASGNGRQTVSCAGLLSVVRWLLLRDFDCVIFLPVVYKSIDNPFTSHSFLLEKLEAAGMVTFTPARVQNQERKAFINYDDLYVATLAHRHGGCILSRDKFQDILNHDEYKDLHDVIRNRVIDVHFMPLGETLVKFGDDMFYHAAPELFLPIPLGVRASLIAATIFTCPDDPQFERVKARRQNFVQRRQECLQLCDDLFLELCERDCLILQRMTTFHSPHLDKGGKKGFDPESAKLNSSASAADEDVSTADTISWLQESASESVTEEDVSSPTPKPTDIDLIDLFTELPSIQNSPAHDEIHDPVPIEQTESPQRTISSNGSSPIDDREDDMLFRELASIFPDDVVRMVLLTNGSRNIEFLANQCVEKITE